RHGRDRVATRPVVAYDLVRRLLEGKAWRGKRSLGGRLAASWNSRLTSECVSKWERENGQTTKKKIFKDESIAPVSSQRRRRPRGHNSRYGFPHGMGPKPEGRDPQPYRNVVFHDCGHW